IVLEHPIKTTGEHEVPIKLHSDVTARFVFQVKSASEEAPKSEAAEAPERGRPTRKRTETK
ncbi:MAG: 50S ribosomal L9 C-terminal domain-containing protein, partial [Chthoniobacterales bacterium]